MHPRPLPHRILATAVLAVSVIGSVVGLGSCGSDDPSDARGGSDDGRPSVVVTYSVLGAVVRDLVGDAADVTVLVPDGVDPHEWEPSARDIEEVADAAVVVSNGFDLEESLVDVLDEEAAVHVAAGEVLTPRLVGDGATDPHWWLDPIAMRDVVIGLAPVLADAGIDVSDRVDAVVADLDALAAEVTDVLHVLPTDGRSIVTGHESLGWFADRFDLHLVGAVVPSLTSQSEPSAGDLAELADAIESAGVSTIFTELGTPPSVVEAIAEATGADVVEISTHNLPDDGRYDTFLLDIARRIAGSEG